jgi:Cysteine-rich CPCC
MNARKDDQIYQRLIVLGLHYPEMRFGQLVCMVAALAGEGETACVRSLRDTAVIDTINAHVTKRYGGRGREMGRGLASLTATRGALIDALKELRGRFTSWHLSELLENLANLAHTPLYDAEDSELLQAATTDNPGVQWFLDYADRLESKATMAPPHARPTYRCPCCRFLTLYARGGFEICPVCYWEDDGQDDADADSQWGGPNGVLSLTEARKNYSQFKTCDPKFIERCREPRAEERE